MDYDRKADARYKANSKDPDKGGVSDEFNEQNHLYPRTYHEQWYHQTFCIGIVFAYSICKKTYKITYHDTYTIECESGTK